MKKLLTTLAAVAVALANAGVAEARGGGGGRSNGGGHYSGNGSNYSSHSSRGYTTDRGTYVAPHRQTNPNSTQRDNYGARGNVSPYTGGVGSRLVDR